MLRYRIYIHWHTLIITNKIKVYFLPFLAFIIFFVFDKNRIDTHWHKLIITNRIKVYPLHFTSFIPSNITYFGCDKDMCANFIFI